jgi:hypothetical protein
LAFMPLDSSFNCPKIACNAGSIFNLTSDTSYDVYCVLIFSHC